MSGGYASWDPPLSYSTVMLLDTSLGVCNPATKTCLRDWGVFDAVSCPSGYFKLPDDEIAGRCAELGLPCPEDYTCLCYPCKKADEVEVFSAR